MPSVHGTRRKVSISFFVRTGRTSSAGSRSLRAIAMRAGSVPTTRRGVERNAVAATMPRCYSSLSSIDLKETVNLPKTSFAMRAALAEREPVQVRAWLEQKIYEKLVAQNEGRALFILHDGPPYANGSLHLGHFLNKTLKDMVVKAQLMSGRLA